MLTSFYLFLKRIDYKSKCYFKLILSLLFLNTFLSNSRAFFETTYTQIYRESTQQIKWFGLKDQISPEIAIHNREYIIGQIGSNNKSNHLIVVHFNTTMFFDATLFSCEIEMFEKSQ